MANGSKKNGEPGWSWRRAAIFPVVVWGCSELRLLRTAADTQVNETIAFGWITLIAALLVGYTGFATAQDIAAIWRMKTGRPYAEPDVSAYQPSDPPPYMNRDAQ
ncbi:MAG: hypothetical protein KL839_04825 [Rhizobium sp.]|nr:hypothetical protein [Rhizobium sp.]